MKSNYRPVSLLNAFSKIIEKVVFTGLCNFLMDISFLKPGFHMIVRIVPVLSKNVQTIAKIIWKRYPDDRKRPGRLRRSRSLG